MGRRTGERAQNQFKPPDSFQREVQQSRSGAPQLVAGAMLFALGCGWVAVESMQWYASQEYYALNGQGSILTLVQRFFLLEAVAIGVALFGAYVTYRGLLALKGDPDSIGRMVGEALSSRRDVMIGTAAAVAYAIVYLFVSGVMIFQPGANYGAWEGITSPGWSAAACCGSVGTVPAVVVYVAPQAHLALQLLPLDALFAVLVPLLVGFNVTVAVHLLRDRVVRTNAGWMSTLGVLTGLFTGCPTCAGYFLASAVGGLGATSLAIALAPYQVLFVVVSIPLLALSPLFIAFNGRRALRAACPVPMPQGASV